MKKRTYTTARRQRIVNEALSTARMARETIDPELLERARKAIGAAAETAQSDKYRPMQAERVPVDQKKNLTIVMKYLELCPDNKALHQEIRAFLSRQ